MGKEERFGGYLLLEPIKSGGMSQVWRAQPEGAASVVALKRVLPEHAGNAEMLEMFLDEARVSVQLSHPNIARVFDLGRVGEELFIAMEYVPGVDLRSVFKRAAALGPPMPVPLVLFVAARLCDALDHAHRRTGADGRPLGIVHRDVAPDNCLVTFDGDVKLVDFGVAKAASQANKTRAGALKGKLGYMSPEQVLGKPLDRRSDVFSLGVVLHEMLTGRRLFWRDNPLQMIDAVRSARAQPPSRVNHKVPAAVDEVVLAALARTPEARYQWASELGDGLRACLAALPAPPTVGHLRRYLSLMFVEELKAERDRRVEWARKYVPLAGAARRAGGRADRSALPTEAELPALSGRRLLPRLEDSDLAERPTVMHEPGRDLAAQPVAADVDLPPPMPSPDRPTQALEAFVMEHGEGEAGDEGAVDREERPTMPTDDTAPMPGAALRRRRAPLEGTAPPAMAPRKPPRRKG